MELEESKSKEIQSPLKKSRNSLSTIFLKSIKKHKKEEQLSPEAQIEYIKEVLLKEKSQRSKLEIKLVTSILSEKFDYFKKLKEEGKNAKSEKIVSVLNLEKFHPEQYIMKYGENGDKFYIILKGKVALYKPIYNRKEMTLKDYSTLIYNIKFNELDDLKYNRLIEKNSHLKIDLELLHKLEPNSASLKQKLIFFIEEDQLLGIFNDGFPFGEIALIKHCTRNASVKVINETYCISLTKNDYNKIMRELEERRLEKNLNTFKKNYPFFQNWMSRIMLKLFNGFSTQKYQRGDYVYKQNENCDYLYILNSGVYECYSLVSFNWVQNFYSYIINAKGNIIKKMIDKKLKETDLKRLYDNLLINNQNSPFQFDPYQFKNGIVSHFKNIGLVDLKNEDEKILNSNQLFKVLIRKIDYKDIIGLEDALECKKRFYYVKCVSDYGEIQKVSVFDFIKVLNLNDEKIKKNLLEIIAEKKRFVYKQIYNYTKCVENRIENNVSYKFDKYLSSIDTNITNDYEYKSNIKNQNQIKKNFFTQPRSNSQIDKNKPFITSNKTENFPNIDNKRLNIKKEKDLFHYKHQKNHHSNINKISSQISQYNHLSKTFFSNDNKNQNNEINSSIKYNENTTNITVTIPVNKPLNRNDLSTLITYKKETNIKNPIHSIKIFFPNSSKTINQDNLFPKKLKMINGKKMKNNNFAYSNIITEFYDDKIKKNSLDKYYCFGDTMYSKRFYLNKNFRTIYDEETIDEKKEKYTKNLFSNLNIMINSKV